LEPKKIILNVSKSKEIDLPTIRAKIGKHSCKVTIDSGAQANILSFKFYIKHKGMIDSISALCAKEYRKRNTIWEKVSLIGANNSPIVHYTTVYIPVVIGKKKFTIELYVVDGIKTEVILGYPTMKDHRMDLLISSDCLLITSKQGVATRIPLITKPHQTNDEEIIQDIQNIHLEEELTLPPHCETLVKANISQFGTSDGEKTFLLR